MTDEPEQQDDGLQQQEGEPAAQDGAPPPSGVALLVLAAACAALVPVVGLLADRTAWLSQPVAGAVRCLALLALLVGGVHASRRRDHPGDGRLMLLVVVASAVTRVAGSLGAIGPAAFAYDLLRWSGPALVALLLLRWPLGRLQTRGQVAVVALGWAGPGGLLLLSDLLFDPVAADWVLTDARTGLGSTPDWWPTIVWDETAALALLTAAGAVSAAALAAFAVLVGRRVRRAAPAARRALVPVVVAAVLVTVPAGLALGPQLRLWDAPAAPLLSDLALAALPVVLLAPGLRRAERPRAERRQEQAVG